MSEIESAMSTPPRTIGQELMSEEGARRVRRRYRADARFRAYGIIAICIALGVLTILVGTLVSSGYTAFVQTQVRVTVDLRGADIDPADLRRADWRGIATGAIESLFPDLPQSDARVMRDMISQGAPFIIRDAVMDDPALIGTVFDIEIPASDRIDQLNKGAIDRDSPSDHRVVTDQQIGLFDQLEAEGRISTPFNTALFTAADSRFPELAGLWGAIVGSFYALSVCLVLAFPIGIAAAIYLEEFAPKNRWTEMIEININNLAAVPSVVFGLLGLAVFLNVFGMPRSAPLVGGMTLALMTMPTIIIASRAALKAVPPSIREGALGVGASHQQAVLHHVRPLAMPGMLTGTIIGLAQALGETAPLLLIGMNAFITAAPDSMVSPSTALPTQIYIWADSPERGFVARTSAAILVLLGFLVCMNAIAIWLRSRLERRW